jgi:ferric-dicitrate binding protein FerR (iron transport regulator)
MKVEDLLRDPSFCNWANDSSQEDSEKWERYLDAHPEVSETLLAAKFMAARQPFEANKPDFDEALQAWTHVETAINTRSIAGVRRRRWMYLAAAASVILLIAAGVLFAASDSPSHAALMTFRTEPGQISEFTLPDGSKVVLNGNSHISFPESFTAGEARAVQLAGEAFFEVTHKESGTPFTIKTPQGNTTVLGTVFNVKSRGTHSVISLLEGAVQVTNTKGKHVVLSPGQTATLSRDQLIIADDDVNARASWRNRLWVFHETPLREVVLNLEESFGITAHVDEDVDLDKTISGKLSTKNLATLYTALETMLGIRISVSEESIIIKQKRNK